MRLLPSASFFWVPPVRIILRPMLSLVYLSASYEHRHFERAKRENGAGELPGRIRPRGDRHRTSLGRTSNNPMNWESN